MLTRGAGKPIQKLNFAGWKGQLKTLGPKIVPPWNLAMARSMFGAKDRMAAWELIADLLDSGLDDTRAIGLAADMFKHRGKRAAWMVLADLHTSFGEGDFEGRMRLITKGAEGLVFSNAGRVAGPVVYRGAARVLRNQKAIRDAVVDATAKPAGLFLVLIALFVLMGTSFFPTLEEMTPRSKWPFTALTIAGIADFLISGGIWAAAGFGAFIALLAASLPLLAAEAGFIHKLRSILDRLPPWSFYRLQTGAAFSFAVVEIARSGGSLNVSTLKSMSKIGSFYSRTHVARIADAMEGGKTFEDAFAADAGFPDTELNALMRALTSQPNTLERFSAYVDRWISDAERLLRAKAALINAALMALVALTITGVITSIFDIMTAVQAGL